MSDNRTSDRKHTLAHDFIVGHEYEVTVRAVGPDGIQQAMEHSARNTIVIKGKLAVPNTPTTLAATGYMNAIGLSWGNPLDYDFDKMEVWRDVDYDGLNRTKIAEVRGITYIDNIGIPNVTRYYWIRAVNTSGQASGYYPLVTGVSATTLGVVVTDIDDFAVTATKMFTKTVILDADSWTNDSPGAGSVAWNAHSVVYNGIIYPITAGNTADAYVYWTIGDAAYSTSASHPTLGTTAFMIAINTSGIHTLVWNSSANMVIGSAFISNLAVTEAKIANLSVTSAKMALATITDAQIASLNVNKVTAGSLAVGYTAAKCTDANADETGVNTAADTAKVQGSTIIVGGYIATAFLTATNIQTGTLTGRTIQTAAANQRIVITGGAAGTLEFYDAGGTRVIFMDDDANGYIIVGDTGNKDFIQLRSGALYTWSETSGKPLIYGQYWAGAAWVNPSFYINANGDAGFGSGVLGNLIAFSGGDITVTGNVDGIKISTHAADNDAHHNQSHTHSFASLTSKPTTLAGYGITDAAPSSHVGAGGAAHADVVAAGADGFMTGADKTKLNGIDANADVTGDNAPQAHDQSAATITTGALNSTARLPAGGETTVNYQIDCSSSDIIQISFSNGQCTNISKI